MWARKHRVCRSCGTDRRPHKGHGFCVVCYFRRRRTGDTEHRDWSREHDYCVVCGTDETPHRAKGMCEECYWKERWKKEKEKAKLREIRRGMPEHRRVIPAWRLAPDRE